MKKLILTAVFLASPLAFAHELDDERTVADQEVLKAKELPATLVVRTSKADPTKVEVVHLDKKVEAGTELDQLSFEQLALNAEFPGTEFDSTNELDARSSTSSWSFGLYYNPGYSRSYNRYYRKTSSYYSRRSSRYYDYCYGYNDCYSDYSYYPRYRNSGYNYNYRRYYAYSDAYYNYDCYDWYYY